MAFVTAQNIQAWVDSTKLTVASVDVELEEAAQEIVFARVGRVYDTTSWVDISSTPKIVRKIIAMLIAAWTYDRQYSEDSEEGSWYARNLEQRALELVEDIANDLIDIADGDPLGDDEAGSPGFYPDDSTGAAPTYDASGYQIAIAGGEDIKFYMGRSF